MDELKALYDEMYRRAAPKGFAALAEDLDTAVFHYADTVIGYANSFLLGKRVDPRNVVLDKDLDQRIAACIERTQELLAYKRRVDALAKTLIEVLEQNQNS